MYFRPSRHIYAHIDCNSFYASCEVLRDPKLQGRAIVVGDQITIAASYEAKKYGIKVGTPFWEAEKTIGKGLVKKRPDHAFYREISGRLMSYLRERLGPIEIFSIDETFAEVTGIASDYALFADTLKASILHDIGIPVSIGISNTRIRAKMFGDIYKPFGSLVEFGNSEIEALFRTLALREIPFIGRGNAERLGYGIKTVYDFYSMDPMEVKKLLGRVGTTLWLELHGVDSWLPHDTAKKRKSIVVSRSFNHSINKNPHFLWREILSNFERAYETLLTEQQGTRLIGVFLRKRDFLYISKFHDLEEVTIDRARMVSALKELFHEVYSSEYEYRTTGITFYQLAPFTPHQLSIFEKQEEIHEENVELSSTLRDLRRRYGESIIHQGVVREKQKRESINILFEVG